MKLIPASVTSKLGVAALKVQHKSPQILFAGGVVGVVGTVVMASRATLKVEEVLQSSNQKLQQINTLQHEAYSETDRKRDRAVVRIQTVLSIAKLYGPALVLGVTSIGMLAGSNHVLSKRNAALAAAYATLEKGFVKYRDRVIEEFGQEKDLEYYRDLREETVVETDENGKTRSVVKKVAASNTTYGRLFNASNPNFQRVPEYNFMFLRGVQTMANDRLKAKGYLFLNDVLDDLGMERTQAGCVVGWLADGDGDGYVDFGIFDDQDTLRIHDFLVGREDEIYIDFNVDGVIYDKF